MQKNINSPAGAEDYELRLNGPESVDRITRTELRKTGTENHLRFREKFKLIIQGWIDGRDNLPALGMTNDGYLHSPFLTQEAKAYSEYETQVWTKIDADLYKSYARAGIILDTIVNFSTKRDLLRMQLPDPPTEDELCQRHPGEENIDIIAVKNRRMRAYRNEVARINSEINALIGYISDSADELSQIYNNIIESEKSARILCESRRDRVKERVSVYWRAAMKKNKSLPPIPDIVLTSDGEVMYDAQHTELRSAIANTLKNKYKDYYPGGNRNEA
ncbi:MAG: hypothetical protein IJK60_11130 [Clostridia bacterium]|nr:hypothetical protein [Clostridia bacterium]